VAAYRRLARGRRLAIELDREGERRDAVRLEHAERVADDARTLANERLGAIHDLTTRRSYLATRWVKRLVGRGEEWW
jgi:hypothetical protein